MVERLTQLPRTMPQPPIRASADFCSRKTSARRSLVGRRHRGAGLTGLIFLKNAQQRSESPDLTTHSDKRKEPDMITTLLTITAMLIFVLFPALLPAAVHAVHGIRNWLQAGALTGATA